MALVSEVIDRVYRMLFPPDERSIQVPLDGAVLAADGSWTLDTSLLTPDELELLQVGVAVEAGQDMRLISSGVSSGVIGVTEAIAGTVAADHADGVFVSVNPPVARLTVFEAVADEIVDLYPTLWWRKGAAITSSTLPVDAPADMVTALWFWYDVGNGPQKADVDQLDELDTGEFSSGKAIRFRRAPSGVDGRLVYNAKFARPTDEADDLDTFGVDEQWLRIVVMGAVAQVLPRVDVARLSAEWLSAQLQLQSTPVGSAIRLQSAFVKQRDAMLEQARRRLRAEQPVETRFRRSGGMRVRG